MAKTFHSNPQVLTSDNNLLFAGFSDTTCVGVHEAMCINIVNLQQIF